jgi:succinyl-diaminopimelate desuccinylase
MANKSSTIQQRLEQRLTRYVAMPTIAANKAACKEAINMLAAELGALGFKTQVQDGEYPWVIGTTRATKHVRILLHAHFDVVMANGDNQYIVTTDDTKLYGRGVFDMKFAAASYMEALTDIIQHDELSAYDLGVLITTDEEIGGEQGVMNFLEQGWTCDIAIIPDGGRDFKIEKRAKGFNFYFLDAHGTSTHGSRPWEGDNPLPKLLPAVQEIISHYKNPGPEKPSVSINGIDTPGSFSQLGALARARIDVRAFEDGELEEIDNHLQSVAKKYDLTLTRHLTGAPVHLDTTNPLVHAFVECQTEVRKQPVEFTESLGASDARYFAAKGIPTIAEYPHGGNAHSAGEWLDRESLVQFYEVIKLYVQRAALDRSGSSIASRIFAAPKKVMRNLLNRERT